MNHQETSVTKCWGVMLGCLLWTTVAAVSIDSIVRATQDPTVPQLVSTSLIVSTVCGTLLSLYNLTVFAQWCSGCYTHVTDVDRAVAHCINFSLVFIFSLLGWLVVMNVNPGDWATQEVAVVLFTQCTLYTIVVVGYWIVWACLKRADIRDDTENADAFQTSHAKTPLLRRVGTGSTSVSVNGCTPCAPPSSPATTIANQVHTPINFM